MEKLADKIEKMLEETLSSYKELNSILEAEKVHIVEMAIDSMWETIAQKKQIALTLEILRKKIQHRLEQRAAELNMDAQNFKLSDFIKKMPDSAVVKSNLRNLRLELETSKTDALSLAAANKKYIDEHLSVINDIFSLVSDTVPKKQYNYTGKIVENVGKNRLINAEA